MLTHIFWFIVGVVFGILGAGFYFAVTRDGDKVKQ